MLTAKHGKPLTEGEFFKDCVRKAVESICPRKKGRSKSLLMLAWLLRNEGCYVIENKAIEQCICVGL